MSYGLWEFGSGSGNYSPESKTTSKENDILDRAIKSAKARYGQAIFQFKVHGGGYQQSGIPDVYVAIGGKSLWVEFKRPGGDTTMLQHKTLTQLKDIGIYCGTAESKETYLKMIEDVLKEDK